MSLIHNFVSSLVWGMVVTLLIVVFLYLIGINKFWKMRGVEYVKPELFFGNFSSVIVENENFTMAVKRLYNGISGKFGGIYLLTQPVLLVRDPVLIKLIMNSGPGQFSESELLTDNLLVFNGSKWIGTNKDIPIQFWDGIVNKMFDALKRRNVTLQEYLERETALNASVDVQDVINRFATDTAASVVFSIKSDCLKNPDEMIWNIGRLIFTPERKIQLRSIMGMAIPLVMEYFDISVFDSQLEKLFRNIIENTLQVRELGKVVQVDYLQIWAQLRNCDKLSDDGKFNIKLGNKSKKCFSIDVVNAQVFSFFVTLLHTSSVAISHMLYELAKNKFVQTKLQTEIDKIPNFTIIRRETIQYMQYLDQVWKETLRKYPVIPIVAYSAVKPFRIPNTELVLEKNQLVFIPIHAIHHDAKYYVHPEEFNPDRFTPDEIKKRTPDIFYPMSNRLNFCDKPGLRYECVILKTKLTVAAICSKFDLGLAPDRNSESGEINFNLRFTKRKVK